MFLQITEFLCSTYIGVILQITEFLCSTYIGVMLWLLSWLHTGNKEACQGFGLPLLLVGQHMQTVSQHSAVLGTWGESCDNHVIRITNQNDQDSPELLLHVMYIM